MKTKILDLIDFEKVDILLEGFNKSTGFVTAILDLEGNVLSKSGWRTICTEFHRVNPETSKKCTVSDTVLANKMAEGEKYHFYQCLNGLVDVAVPIVIKGEHIANLFYGQFFFEEPDEAFFQKQAEKFGFKKEIYLKALGKVPVVSKEKVKDAMDFLLNMTQLISEMTFHKLEQMELNEAVEKHERILRLFVEHSPASIAMFDNNMRYLVASRRFMADYNLGSIDIIGRSHYEIFPEISEHWKEFHRRGLAGETLKESNDQFPRADGATDWVRWEIRPWHVTGNQIGGIILFSEVITTQIEASEALRESEKYNRMLFEQSAIGLALADMDGKLVDVNTAYAAIAGYTVDEAKELTYWELTPKKYEQQEQEQLVSLAQTGKYGPYEKEYIHKDGHLVPVRLHGSMLERNGQKFIWSSVEDVTERKKAELDLIAAKEEIEASERIKSDLLIKFNEAQQSAKIGNWDWDMITNKVWWSNELYRIFDLDPAEFVPDVESNAKYVHPDDNGPYHEEVRRVIENKEELDTELRIISGNGTLKYCNSKAKLELDENDSPIRLYGTFADITERKMAEATLTESEKRYRGLFENMPAGFVLFEVVEDANGIPEDLIIRAANEGFEQTAGLNAQKVTGQRLTYALPGIENDAANWIGTYGQVALSGKPLQFEQSSELLGIYYSVNAYQASPKQCAVMFLDITDRKKAEEAVKRMHDQLITTLETMIDGFVSLDKQWRYTYMNKFAGQIFGRNPEEMIGKHIWTEFPEGVGQPFHQAYELCMNEQRFVQLEEYYPPYDKWFANRIFPSADGLSIFFQDITDRKKAEKEIEKSNRELQTISRILSTTTNILDISELLDKILAEALEIVGLEGGTVCMVGPDDTLKLIAERETSEATINDLTQNNIKIGDCLCGNCAINLCPLILRDRDAVLKYATREALRGEDIRFHAAFPFTVKKKSLGVLCVFTRTDRKPEERSLKLIETLTMQVSLAIENAMLFEEVRNQLAELLRAETELKESEEKYRSIFENSSVAILLTSPDGRILSANDFACRLFDRNEKEICEAGRTGIIDLTDTRLTKLLKERENTGKTRGELAFLKKDGSKFEAEVSSVIFTDIDGNQRTSMVIRDLTEQKQAEKSLKESEELLRLSTELANVAAWEYNFETDSIIRSKNHDSLFGMEEQKVWRFGTFINAIHPDDRELSAALIKNSVAEGGPDKLKLDFRIIYPDQTIHWLNLIGEVVTRNGKGAGAQTRGFLIDITDRKQAEIALQHSKEYAESLIQTANVIVIGLNSDGEIVVMNEAAEQITGYTFAELKGGNWFEILVPKDKYPEVWDLFLKYSGTGEGMKTFENPILTKSGTERYISWQNGVLHEGDQITGTISFGIDITEKRQAEKELLESEERLKKLNEELEHRIQERTEKLVAANKELETFTYSVSHDLKAPLRGIDGYSKLLSDLYAKDLNDEAKHFISTIRRSTQLMSQLIDDLLQYSRLERSQLRNEPVVIKSIVNAILKVNEDEIISGGFSVTMEVPDKAIIADSNGIQMALRNLIENAIKFTKTAPEPVIEIKQVESDNFWLISVKDNGIGFDMKYSQRIFEIFQRLHRVEDYPGTGIGLAMVGKAMQRMNGRAWAESTPEQGATFYLEIPK